MNCNNKTDKFATSSCCAPAPECCIQGPRGDRGPQGPVGATGAAGADGTSETLTLGTVYTVDSDTPASAVDTTGSPDHVWELYVPQGADGQDGQDGKDGQDGQDGPSETLTLGNVFTVDSGTPASAVDTAGAPDHVWDLYIPQGEKGDKGSKGDKGDKGCQGIQGERGDTGLQGIQGEEGCPGDKGDVGCKGDKGDKGERGDTGIQGERGEQGLQGIQGERGERGKVGDRGDQGIQGITGDKGEKGDKGDRGDRGDKGERGDQGIQGITGDKGEKGDKGDTGPQGIQGVMGATGATGATGAQGATGPQGPMGCGIPGPQGAQGVAGPAGDCCDPTCTNTMSQLLDDIATQQQSIIDKAEGDNTDAVVQLLTTSLLDSQDAYLSDVIIDNNNSGTMYQFTSDSITDPLTNLVAVCDISAICAPIDSTMGQWIADYNMPGYIDSSTCPATLDKIDFFTNYLQYCCDKGISLSIGDSSNISSMQDVKLLEVSNGLIKIRHPFDTSDKICIVSVCHISRIYYYRQISTD